MSSKIKASKQKARKERAAKEAADNKTMTVLIVEPLKEPRVAKIRKGLESLQRAVDGRIQALYPYADQVALICNEDGIAEGLPLNRDLIYDPSGELVVAIRGTFLVVGLTETNYGPLSHALVKKYSEIFHEPKVFTFLDGKAKAYPVSEATKMIEEDPDNPLCHEFFN